MLRSIGEQSEKSVESLLKKNRKAMGGRIYRKGSFKPGMKECGGDGILTIISINVSSLTTE